MIRNNFKKIKNRNPYDMPELENYDSSTVIKAPEKFEVLIDRHIISLKKQGIDVAICADYLDSLIENHITSLFNAIELKHQKNLDFIKNIFVRRATDKKEFERLLTEYDEEIASTYEEYKFVEELYENHNPLQKGRLELTGFSEGDMQQEEEGVTDE